MTSITSTKQPSTLGATLLITGCCIGAGMIGLPVISALAGFMPSALAMLLCYVFTTLTGLLLLEATLWFDHPVSLPSIVEFALGKSGKMIAIFLFLFLFYCIFVAYLDSGGSLFADILSNLFHRRISHTTGVLFCVDLVAFITYLGTRTVDSFNRTMMIGLIISYGALVYIGLPSIDSTNLIYKDWASMFAVIPILLICFGYQNLVPSITHYLKRNVNAIRLAIIIGNLIPFFIYFLWDYVIIGMLTSNVASNDHTTMVIDLLRQSSTPTASILFLVKSFSLFAVLTSFIPCAVSFIDFFKDVFKHSVVKNQYMELAIYFLVFVPPTVCALVHPHIFLQALSFAGGFIDVLLFGVIPSTVVLIGRNFKEITSSYQLIGGNVTPILVVIFSIAVLMLKVYGT